MVKTQPPEHYAADYDLDVTSGDDDLFKWFLLCYLFGKPIQSSTAELSWHVFMKNDMDTPWAIVKASHRHLNDLLYEGKYARYADSTARGMQVCMQQLIQDYDGSLMLMLEYSEDERMFSKRLQQLHGVGPKVAEIFMREIEEIFARRIE